MRSRVSFTTNSRSSCVTSGGRTQPGMEALERPAPSWRKPSNNTEAKCLFSWAWDSGNTHAARSDCRSHGTGGDSNPTGNTCYHLKVARLVATSVAAPLRAPTRVKDSQASGSHARGAGAFVSAGTGALSSTFTWTSSPGWSSLVSSPSTGAVCSVGGLASPDKTNCHRFCSKKD